MTVYMTSVQNWTFLYLAKICDSFCYEPNACGHKKYLNKKSGSHFAVQIYLDHQLLTTHIGTADGIGTGNLQIYVSCYPIGPCLSHAAYVNLKALYPFINITDGRQSR